MKIVGAWHANLNNSRGITGYQIVFLTEYGTAHAGSLRKAWHVPEEVRAGSERVTQIANASFVTHPLLVCDDAELAEAFERLIGEPAFSKIPLNDWEFKLAADAPVVFLQWGRFTWKQRKYLREIVKKIFQL